MESRRHPPESTKPTRNLSISRITADRLDAIKGPDANRSALFEELLKLGAAKKWGPRWEEMADGLLQKDAS